MYSIRVSNTEKSDAGGFSVVPLTTLAPKDRGQTGTMSCQRHTCTAPSAVRCKCGVRAGHSTTRPTGMLRDIVEATAPQGGAPRTAAGCRLGLWSRPPRRGRCASRTPPRLGTPPRPKNKSVFVPKSVKMRKSIGSNFF